jgi:hypothetical protein
VGASVDVLYGMVNDLMRILSRKSLVGEQVIRIERRSRFDVLTHLRLKGMFLAVDYYGRAKDGDGRDVYLVSKPLTTLTVTQTIR